MALHCMDVMKMARAQTCGGKLYQIIVLLRRLTTSWLAGLLAFWLDVFDWRDCCLTLFVQLLLFNLVAKMYAMANANMQLS